MNFAKGVCLSPLLSYPPAPAKPWLRVWISYGCMNHPVLCTLAQLPQTGWKGSPRPLGLEIQGHFVGVEGWTSAHGKKHPQCSSDQQLSLHSSDEGVELYVCTDVPWAHWAYRPSGSAMPPSALQSQVGSKACASPCWSTLYKPISDSQTEVPN